MGKRSTGAMSAGLGASASGTTKEVTSGRCSVEQDKYCGWDAYRLTNGLITLHVVPAIGGRVIQFELGDHAYFSIHPKLKGKVVPPPESDFGMSWKNYGGDKIWTAPQGWQRDDQWPGPPDPVLDAGAYTAEVISAGPAEAAIRLTSPPDERSGVQIGRTLRIRSGSSQVALELFMRNISLRPVRWSLWEVTQHDTTSPGDPKDYNRDFWAYCPVNPRSMFPTGFNYMFGPVNNPAFTLDPSGQYFRVHYRYHVGKVGLDSDAGWLAVVNRRSRHGFFETFDYVPGAAYADNASVEFWMQGPGQFINNQEVIEMANDPEEFPYLMESEVVSPFAKLQPGEEYRFRLSWFAARTDGPVLNVTDAGAIHEPLVVERSGSERKCTGKFAVFHEGSLLATFYSAAGATLSSVQLGEASPLTEFVLDRRLPVPEAAYRVSITLRNRANANLGALAETVLVD